MPRGPRLDAPGILHHVRLRGIERRKLFLDDHDRTDFLERLELCCADGQAFVYAWCLMDNHVHLAVRTGRRPLSRTMSRVLTGYAVRFNLRHKRSGHLLQNRYTSTVVEDEPYFLNLVRYIHLNPVRARIVGSLDELARYLWTGHAVLMGKRKAPFQDTDEVLARFGVQVGGARRELKKFMGDPEAKRDEKVFKGARGGLVRSIGGMSELREHSRGPKWAHDDRILGSGDFVTSVLEQAEQERPRGDMDDGQRWAAYDELVKRICRYYKIDTGELLGGGRRRIVVRARKIVAYVATRKLGLSSAAVARTMNVSTAAISKAVSKGRDALDELGVSAESLARSLS